MKIQKAGNLLKKGGKGFTLVELMIVIAVIALLIIVLVPRIGVIRNKAKEAGVRTNVVMIKGLILNNIGDFPVTDEGCRDLEDKIAADITSAPTGQKMVNPFTQGITVQKVVPASVVAGAIAVYDGTGYGTDALIDAAWKDGIANCEGVVAYGAHLNAGSTAIEVRIIPFGAGSSGVVMKGLMETITQ